MKHKMRLSTVKHVVVDIIAENLSASKILPLLVELFHRCLQNPLVDESAKKYIARRNDIWNIIRYI